MEYNNLLNKDYLLNYVKMNFNIKKFNMADLIKTILLDLNNYNNNNINEYIKKFEHNIIYLDKLYSLCLFYVSNNIKNSLYNFNEILTIIDNFYDNIYNNENIYNILSSIDKTKSNIINKIYKKCQKYKNINNDETLKQLYILKNKNKEILLELKNKEFKITLPKQIKEELQDTPFNNLIYEDYIYLTINNYFDLIKILNPLYTKKIISLFFQQLKEYIINYLYYNINKYTYLNKINDLFNKSNIKKLSICTTLLNKFKKYISEDYITLEYYCKYNGINFENIKYEELIYYVNIFKENNYSKIKLLDFKLLNEKELFDKTLQKIIQYLTTIFQLKLNKKIINNNYRYLMRNPDNNKNIELSILFNQDKFKLINIIDNINIIYLPKLTINNILDYILPFSSFIGEIIYIGLNNEYEENYKLYKMIFNKFCEIVIFKNINLIFPKEYILIKKYYTTLLSIYYQNIIFESSFKYYMYNSKVMKSIIEILKKIQIIKDDNNNLKTDEEKDDILIKYINELYNNYYNNTIKILDKYNIFNTIFYYDIDYFKLLNIDIIASTLYKQFEHKLNIKKNEYNKKNNNENPLDTSIYNVFGINDLNQALNSCNQPSIDNLTYIYYDDVKINNIIKEDELNNEIINEDDNNCLLTETAYNIQKVVIL